MVKVVSVKFARGSKPYFFAPGKDNYEKGMGVIVETAKGPEYATVVEPVKEVSEEALVSALKPVIRIATEKDTESMKKNMGRRDECLKIAQQKIAERGLEMKPVDCEISFDGSRITIFFSAEHRVDFRELIKDLSSAYHMRIELRQINIREEIQHIGGIAPCGRICCCNGCMEEPVKATVKMAKNQGLSLNPQKISGLCGRLMCCLAYENEYYSEVCKKVPKIGSEADTPDGVGTVINVNMLKMTCKVKFEKGDVVTYRDYAVDDLRFVRGNVVMGRTDDDDADVIEEEEEGAKESAPRPEEKRNGRDRDRRREGQQKSNRERRPEERGGKPRHANGKEGENKIRNGEPAREGNPQSGESNRPRKNKHKHRFKPKNNGQKNQ